MSREVTVKDCLAEIERFFRYYNKFCESPEPDSVREVLASIYSVNDKLRKAKYPNFFNDENFIALKAIRNYAIHQSELYNKTKALPLISTSQIVSDLNILCLLPKDIVENIYNDSSKESISAIKKVCIFYKEYIDIYPPIFNFGVKLFLYTEKNKLYINSKEYSNFKNSIEYEREEGLPHFVVGGIKFIDGTNVDSYIEQNLTTLIEKVKMQSSLYTENNGMYTFKGL